MATKATTLSRVPRTQEETLTNSHDTKSSQITQNDAPNAMLKTPVRCSIPSLLNFNKATKAIGGIREEEQIVGATPNYFKI
jgi:hypothetical protein